MATWACYLFTDGMVRTYDGAGRLVPDYCGNALSTLPALRFAGFTGPLFRSKWPSTFT